MTDINNFINAEGRADLIKEVRKKIDMLGVQYIYLQFVSITGRVSGKGIPAKHWEAIANKGFQLVYGAMVNVSTNHKGEYIGYGPNQSELVGIPEPETFCQLPWDKRVARVFCTLFHNREELNNAGSVLLTDCRGNLKRAHAIFKQKHDAQLRCGTEPEMMWLKKNDPHNINEGCSKPYPYHIEQFEILRPIFMRVLEYSQFMGLDIIQGDHEDAPGQLELNIQFDDIMRNADRLITYRQICAQVAREFNIEACFVAKPFMGVSANGCHHNISLWRGGREIVHNIDSDNVLPAMNHVFTYSTAGQNIFIADNKGGMIPSLTGQHAIGGIVKHMPALTAIACSTVNSYRRLWDTGFWAPILADWGIQNRTSSLRISAPGRFEYRNPDSMVNPYLMGSVLLTAIDDGLEHNIECPKPQEGNAYNNQEQHDDAVTLPMTLYDSLQCLAKDDVIKKAMPGDMFRLFYEHKYDEWVRFNASISNWDMDTYRDYIP